MGIKSWSHNQRPTKHVLATLSTDIGHKNHCTVQAVQFKWYSGQKVLILWGGPLVAHNATEDTSGHTSLVKIWIKIHLLKYIEMEIYWDGNTRLLKRLLNSEALSSSKDVQGRDYSIIAPTNDICCNFVLLWPAILPNLPSVSFTGAQFAAQHFTGAQFA